MGITEQFKRVKGPRNYRTSVMYDFAPVVKAKFYIYPMVNDKVMMNEILATLPVQVNPNFMEMEAANTVERIQTISETAGANPKGTFRITGKKSDNFEVELTLDVYDEYMAQTANDSIPLIGTSILDERAFIFQDLRYYVTSPTETNLRYVARFVWGSGIDVFGILQDVSINISCFSRWGTPLKGTARVKMFLIPAPDNSPVSALKTAWDRAEEIATVTALVASEALR